MDTNEIVAGEAKYLVGTYTRPEVVFTHGQGAYLFDSKGDRYLDFSSGIAVTALGHGNEAWVTAVQEQAAQLTHVSNLYYTAPQVELAKRLVENSFADRVFFNNSGSEAIETAFKFSRVAARRRHSDQNEETFTKSKIVAFSGSFHGRTMGALSATYKSKYRAPFAPLVPGIAFAGFNDLVSAQELVDDDTCAVVVEPIQGEGGVNSAKPEFLQTLRQLCDEHEAILVFDEVQCGLGRSGQLWAHQAYDVTPDIMTLAKPLAGGLPIGATLVTEAVAQLIVVGDHGSTFAGGPLVCRAAQVVFDQVIEEGFLEKVAENGRYLMNLLDDLPTDKIVDVRGKGLLVGMELKAPVAPIVNAARDKGLLIISAGENVLRLAPPLIVEREQIETAVAILGNCLWTL